MPWTPPSDPVTNTIITVAYALANLLSQIRHLRVMTGNADPPGSSYALISTSTAATAWSKLPADALAANAVTTHLGYTPVNKAGDTGLGSMTSTGTVTAERLVAGATGVSSGGPISSTGGITNTGGGVAAGGPLTCTAITPSVSYNGGSTAAGRPALLGLDVGAGGINVVGGGAIAGGTTAGGGDLNVIGANVGAHGLAVAGAGGLSLSAGGGIVSAGVTVLDGARNLSVTSYGGGTTAAGNPAVLGVSVGGNGIAVAGQINSTVLHPTPPMILNSQGKVTNLHADVLDGAHASATPSAGAIPIADAGGKLDAWVSASGAASIPAGMGAAWSGVVASIPGGWTRWNNLNGRLPVGAGTTFSTTFVEGGSYGSSWGHSHTGAAHSHSGAALGVGGNTGGPSSTGTGGGVGASFGDGSHTHGVGTFDVSGSTDSTTPGASGDTAWAIPMFGVVWVLKS